MKLHHIAIWTFRLEELKEFYVRFFGGKSNEKYINPKKGFESYFISFGEGTDLELMSRTDVQNTPIEENRVGLTHFAFTFPSQEEVLRFTEQMRSEGYTIAGEPRTSGDGYFESVVLDPDGNRIECVYRRTANESKNKARQETEIESIPPVTLHTERLFSALSKKEMQKHFSLVARTRIWEIMPDGRPIVRWMNPAGYFIPHLSTRRGYGQ